MQQQQQLTTTMAPVTTPKSVAAKTSLLPESTQLRVILAKGETLANFIPYGYERTGHTPTEEEEEAIH